MISIKKKIKKKIKLLFLYYTCHFEILDYSFNEFVIIYSLYFVCHCLFGGTFFYKKIDIGFII